MIKKTYLPSLKRTILMLTIISFFLCSATECNKKQILFTAAQPADKENLASFDEKIQGKYTRVSKNFPESFEILDSLYAIYDSVILFIEEKHIVSDRFSIANISSKILDTTNNIIIEKDSIFDLSQGGRIGFPYVFRDNNYKIVLGMSHDTLFSLYSGNKLKKHKTHYFLNKQNGGYWDIAMLSPMKNQQLLYSECNDSSDISLFRKHSPVFEIYAEPDSLGNKNLTGFLIDCNPNNFKKVVKKKGFRHREVFQLIK